MSAAETGDRCHLLRNMTIGKTPSSTKACLSFLSTPKRCPPPLWCWGATPQVMLPPLLWCRGAVTHKSLSFNVAYPLPFFLMSVSDDTYREMIFEIIVVARCVLRSNGKPPNYSCKAAALAPSHADSSTALDEGRSSQSRIKDALVPFHVRELNEHKLAQAAVSDLDTPK